MYKIITFQVSVSSISRERSWRGQEISTFGSEGGFSSKTLPQHLHWQPENFPVILKHNLAEVERI